jgi:hypothetical protein
LERLAIELGPLPPWRQIIAGLGLVTSIVGGILIKMTFSWTQAFIGTAALFGGGIVYFAAVHAGRDANTSNAQSVEGCPDAINVIAFNQDSTGATG